MGQSLLPQEERDKEKKEVISGIEKCRYLVPHWRITGSSITACVSGSSNIHEGLACTSRRKKGIN